ncbi:hypothetical protein R75461_05277 [Paraburkholderia nemoris]|uniref:terminase small subunit-like protein n=1 Tax=Paraburkholderia nemoris TaxID=2793076 RepID=UPI001AFEDCFC|nr:hypothetical protein R75461_05277 [Paraburkholderia nemoris]CAE6876182.1 hypothetical protein R69608_01421 [Paraburkholderia nemoris]
MISPRRFVSDATIRLILASVSNGQPLIAACESAGVSRRAFYTWLQTDQQLVNDYAQAVQQQTRSRFSRS